MGEFNSDDHYIYYCGQESLRRNGVAIMVNKRVRNTVLGCNLKNDKIISVRFQGKPFTRDMGLIPGSGRSPGEGNSNPLQYSCLENSMDRGTWKTTVHGVSKSRTWLND